MIHHDTTIRKRKAEAKAKNKANREKAQLDAKARKLAKKCTDALVHTAS